MTTTAERYQLTFDAIALHARQDDAVLDYLRKHRVIDRDFAEHVGLPACGKIRNLAQRIRELRLRGIHIKTDRATNPANCHYWLISEPQ